MKKSILIITYHMLPYVKRFGDCQRIFFMAEYLTDKGYDVFVINAKKKAQQGYFGYHPSFKQIALSIKENWLTKYILLKSELGGKISQRNKNIFILFRILRVLIKRILLQYEKYAFNEPNPTYGLIGNQWINSNKRKIFEIIENNDIQNVIISAPPFALFKIVDKIKKRFPNIQVIMNYRDPWNCWNLNQISKNKEMRYTHSADSISVFSDKYRQDAIKHLALYPEKIITVSNGYSENTWNRLLQKKTGMDDKLIITYTGGFSFDTNSYVGIDALLNAVKEIIIDNSILFRFVGNVDTVNAEKWESILGSKVEFIHNVSHEESIKYLQWSDVVLVIYTSTNYASQYMLTGKYFDYLRSNKVIWGIGEPNSNFNELIKKHQLGVHCKNQKDQIQSTIKKLISTFECGEIGSLRVNTNIDISHYSIESQNKKIEKLFKWSLSNDEEKGYSNSNYINV